MTKSLDSSVISKRIREERERNSLTQAKLAKEAKVTPAAISQIESGKRTPNVPVLHRIAGVLNVSMDYLIGQSDQSQVVDMAQNSEFLDFYKKFQELSKENREQILDQMEFFKAAEAEINQLIKFTAQYMERYIGIKKYQRARYNPNMSVSRGMVLLEFSLK